MNKMYAIIVVLSITTWAHGAAAYPDKPTQSAKPSSGMSVKPTSSRLAAAVTAVVSHMHCPYAADRHPAIYTPGMGIQFSDHSLPHDLPDSDPHSIY